MKEGEDMKVKDIMVWTAASCRADMNLGEAVEIMWNRNCGILPVVNEQSQVTGVITDRDICIALGTRNRLPGKIKVKDVATPSLYCCKREDDVRLALQTMAQAKVRRLPVVNKAGSLEGILSMDDVVFHAETANHASDISAENVLDTLKAVYSANLPQPIREKAAYV
jgi:CBS domain-containing protein